MKKIFVKGTEYILPIYLLDATRGVVKSLDSGDLENAGVRGVVVNTYHLMSAPGVKVIEKFSGIKSYMNFNGLVATDSGGWQIFSMIHRFKKSGKISDRGVIFSSEYGRKEIFTPELSIKTQFSLNSDIIICLDDFTKPDANEKEIEESVMRTIKWAKLSKKEYLKQLNQRNFTDLTKPLIFAVVQGAMNKELRKYCADELVKIGFDGYGYGGYVVDEKRGLNMEMSKYLSSILPSDSLKFALGVGSPWEIAACCEFGWDIFDCTLPTRDARHRRLYTFKKSINGISLLKDKSNYEYIYIDKEKYKNDESSISEICDCYVCKKYSKAYLHHLFKIKDTLSYRLATIHNLRFYSKLLELVAF